jgi:hypothetical protein
MKKIAYFLIVLFAFVLYTSCKKTDTTAPAPLPVVDPCIGITVQPVVDATNTITAQSLGTITVKSPIGSGFTYSIGGVFQSSTNFFSLPAGNYTVTTKSAEGCSGTAAATIKATGAKFYDVRKIVTGYCGPCHLNGTMSGGKNYDADSSIANAWNRIKARAVDGTPSFMPQGGQLTAPDKQKIVDWVNAGHRITD